MGKNAKRLEAFDHICRYANTFAVFQGGAAKAIAYIGAYKKAAELGFVFSETAGTSAGSIFAALIAAGATPAQIEDLVKPEDLKKLAIDVSYKKKHRGKTTDNKSRWRFLKPIFWFRKIKAGIKWTICSFIIQLTKGLKCIITKLFQLKPFPARLLNSFSIIGFLRQYGIYDSDQLYKVVEGWLYTITGIHNITFDQLDKNLWIVATDVDSKSYKLWSKYETPNEKVAYAVAASCCIPFYYTPFDEKYIDGGLLSNRPDFVFEKLPENYNILSFRTESTSTESQSLGTYIKGIVSSLLEGADMLQHRNIREIKTITIDVEDFNGLDFWSITNKDIRFLIKKGSEAMNQFYEQLMNQKDVSGQWDTDKTTDILESMNQVISLVAIWSMNDFEEIWISDYTLDWVWPLFPTVLKWCHSEVNVRVFCATNDNPSPKQIAIRRQLHYVGIEIEDTDPSTIQRGFFFKDKNGWKAVCFCEIDDKFYGKRYSTLVDNDIINAEIQRISQHPSPKQTKYKPVLERIDPQIIMEDLKKGVEFYKDASFSFEKIHISDLTFMSRFARGDKYIQIGSIFSLYASSGLENMYPAQINMLEGKKSKVTPIIVEEHDDQLIVIKGNVRLLFAYKANPKINEIWAIVVRNVNISLPSRVRIGIDKLFLSETKKIPQERYGDDYDPALNRNVDQALRHNESYLS